MRKVCKISVLFGVSLALAVLSCAGAFAQDEAPVKINLTAAKTSFEPTDTIKLQIRVYNDPNDATADVITRKGFFGQNFYTLITFTDPDGFPVRNKFKDETDEPGPPDALAGPKHIQMDAPASAASRQSAYNMGVSNVGDRRSFLNPSTNWPESSFYIPLREGPMGQPEPMFGSVIDYTKGRISNPPTAGTFSSLYSSFNPQYKSMPGYNNTPMMSPATSMNRNRNSGWNPYWG